MLTDLGRRPGAGRDAAGEVTPAYVDPIVARGGAPGPASDVFGVAAAAFHALTGVAPWNAATPGRHAAPSPRPGSCPTSPSWRRTRRRSWCGVARGLAADPHERGLGGGLRAGPAARLPAGAGAAARAGVPDAELGAPAGGRGPS